MQSSALADGIFLTLLLAGSVACIAACLWLAQCITAKPRIMRGIFAGQESLARTGLGVIATGGSLVLLLGVLPGTFMNPWTALAACGTAMLGMLTIVSAQRGESVLEQELRREALRLDVSKPASSSRKAA